MARSYTAKKQRQTNAGKSRRRTQTRRLNTRTVEDKLKFRKEGIEMARKAFKKSKDTIPPKPRHIRYLFAYLFYKDIGKDDTHDDYNDTMLNLTDPSIHKITVDFIKHCYETDLDKYFQIALYNVFQFLQEEAFGGLDDYKPKTTSTPKPAMKVAFLTSLLIERYRQAHKDWTDLSTPEKLTQIG